jgi:CheY-like chemotaxis protein
MTPTVLVVEDNSLNLELVRDLLTAAGMQVIEARTAHEGLSAAARLKPSLILLDIRLPGLPAEFRGVIFEKFGQAPLGQAAAVRSTGLGLTFCKLAVEAHRGKIGMESAEGGGSRFWVELFRAPARS